jgi:hypothetical protein
LYYCSHLLFDKEKELGMLISSMIKLLMSWNIQPGKESAYMEFITHDFTPALAKLGLQPTEAWYTMAGSGPQVLAAGVAENRETMAKILQSDEWRALEEKLLDYVTDYKYKIVPAAGHFQL